MKNPTREEMIADMQRAIRTAREAIDRLRAGDYTGLRYCGGPQAAEFIIKNRFETTIKIAERVIDQLTTPEDLA